MVLQDVNDNPPEFIPSSVYHARISEASQPGIEVKQVLAVDRDKNSNLVSYYLETGSSNFEISDANKLTGKWNRLLSQLNENHLVGTFWLVNVVNYIRDYCGIVSCR